MQYRSLGRTGVMVSPLCLGAMNFGGPTGEAESVEILEHALDAGINFVDTANVYNAGESERILGRAFQKNGRRDQVILATKVFGKAGDGPNDNGASRYHVMRSCEDSLRRLQTDHIDLFQLHRPSATIPQDETLRAFDDLVQAGKVRYIGSSTHPAWKVMEALAISEKYGLARYISEQPPYNLLDRRIENELVPLCQQYGMAIIPWSPLAMGVLAGRYPADGSTPEGSRAARAGSGPILERVTRRSVEVGWQVAELAKARGLTAGQFSLLWCKDQPAVTAPIIGPRTLAHLEEFIPVMDMQLNDEDRAACDALVHPGNAVADFHNSNDWMKARVNA
jgi:aryl-alcohol dehydrogenase-like predicted oxidoreductase